MQPPKFVFFVNYPNLMLESYQKYLYNKFRETYGFTGVPIRLFLKGKEKSKRDLSSNMVKHVPGQGHGYDHGDETEHAFEDEDRTVYEGDVDSHEFDDEKEEF